MSQVLRVLRIGHVDDRSAVGLFLPRDRVDRASAMMPHIGDPAVTLLLDLRLIRAASLQVVVADELHVGTVGAFAVSMTGLSLRCNGRAEEDRQRHKCQMPSLHNQTPLSDELSWGNGQREHGMCQRVTFWKYGGRSFLVSRRISTID
jgi:hypothetical protein